MSDNKYMNAYMKKRYMERRKLAFSIIGDKCKKCGSINDLQIDHIDPKSKSFRFDKFWNINLKDFKRELKKCQPLCNDCHIIKTINDLDYIPASHGRRTMYRRGCRCDKCKEAQRIGMKRYRIWKKTGIKPL